MQKVIIDSRMATFGGIGTYISNLTKELNSFVEPLPLTSSIYSIREQWEMKRRIPFCDLFWSPHYNIPLFSIRAQKRVVTIHDVYHLDYLDTLSFAQKTYAKKFLKGAVEKSDLVITVSEFSKGRILHYFPEIEDKIQVIHSGSDHLLSVDAVEMVGVKKPFFLMVGNGKPHKNLSFVFEAFKKGGLGNLVVVGGAENKVSEGELKWLYQNAEALIFPSLYEGWGLPPLEAMSLECPVIASHAASIPEACGEAALYFNPHSMSELIDQIRELPNQREKLIGLGKKRAELFTWKKAAERHRQTFEAILS